MKLIIENIRCFGREYTLPIKPLTLLIGENSTGKTTLLSILSLTSDIRFPTHVNFNNYPYELGNYDTIATYKGGKGGRAKSFSIGLIFHENDGGEKIIKANYTNQDGQAKFTSVALEDVNTKFIYRISRDGFDPEGILHIKKNNRNNEQTNYTINFKRENISNEQFQNDFPGLDIIMYHIFASDFFKKAIVNGNKISKKTRDLIFEQVVELISIKQHFDKFLSIAPIRTRPKRTYDQLAEKYDPEGNHIPFILSKVFLDKGYEERTNIINALKVFGIESGLFSDIKVKNLGKNIGDPFQVYVKAQGQFANILDVGYGVNQILPVITESIIFRENKKLLLQQPEVHLHPKAQAALGSFFSKIVAAKAKEFVIETHSDFIIDRIRQEIADGTISHDLVSILYFEKNGYLTNIYDLKLDSLGNIIDPPSGYRQFFIDEEIKLLQRGI